MYEAGADVVFHAAGGAGVGVFEAATALSTDERQLWAIGVDSDQYETVQMLPGAVNPDAWRRHILTSVIKRFDIATHDIITDFTQGGFVPGKRAYDLASRAVDLSFSGGYLNEFFGEINAARKQINDGTVIVPCYPTERMAEAHAFDVPLPDDYCWR